MKKYLIWKNNVEGKRGVSKGRQSFCDKEACGGSSKPDFMKGSANRKK